jgi:hypothetical protein
MKNYCCIWLFLLFSTFTFGQEKRGKIDLKNEHQINVLKLKGGTRYVGRIQSMSAKKITFQLKDIPTAKPIIIRRRNVKIVGSYNVSTDNEGMLRLPFLRISEDYPNLLLDPKLDSKNKNQQVEIWQGSNVFTGRI